MSRIGKKPIPVPANVKVAVSGEQVQVEGPKGKISERFRREVRVKVDDKEKRVLVERTSESPFARAYHGTSRALIANMVRGVTVGFQRNLDIVGVGFNAKVQGKNLVLQVGFSHPVELPIPEGVQVEIPNPTKIFVKSSNKQKVGEFAAEIRRIRPPEPYKGKGIRYEDEKVIRKAGKAFGATAT